MAKSREAIGLDIGAQTIKMVRLEAVGDSVYILDCKIREYLMPEGKLDAVREVLKDFISNKIPIVVSVEGSSVFIRVFKLPGVTKGKLNKIVAYEAQQQVPFPIEEVVWTYQCLRRVSPEETDVALAAVKKSVVVDFLGILAVDIADIVPPVIGLNNLLSWIRYEDIKDPTGQAVMVLDLGARTTNVIIIEKQNLWFRIIPIGGEVITQAVSDEYGISFSEAELLKKEKGEIILDDRMEPNLERKRISTCIIKSLTRLTSEISRSIEVYSSNFNSLGPRKAFITGGFSNLRNIGNFFNKKFRVDVYNLNIGKKFNIQDNVKKEKFLHDIGRFGAALGLALQGLGLGKTLARKGWVMLSLLPKEILQKYKWLNRQAYLTAVSGLLVFLGACFSLYNLQITNIYKANVSRLQGEQKAVDFHKKQLIDIKKEFDSVIYRMDKINEIRFGLTFWLDVLLELERLLPDNVWLAGIGPVSPEEGFEEHKSQKSLYIDYAGGAIDLKIDGKTTGTYQDIMTLADALNNSRYFLYNSSIIISANPPVDGVRDFLINVKAKVPSE